MTTPRATTLAILLATAAPAVAADSAWFVDVAGPAGVDFVYRNGMTGEFWFPEIMGGGVALLDYDNDGRLDIYLVQGGLMPGTEGDPAAAGGDRLYRNESSRDEDGHWLPRFRDVTSDAGIEAHGYGMGVATGDYDADGFTDLYVLNLGDNQLWRNNGDGTFSDRTVEAGVNDPGWSVSGSFGDLDGDGRPELVVVNYADYTVAKNKACRSTLTNQLDYCSPSAYEGVPDRLFRNLGDGRFEDVTAAAGLAEVAHHGLGVVIADLDYDGLPDIYVANDGDPNSLWLNEGGLAFRDEAFLAGSAVNADGMTEAGMGVDAGDFDRSGAEDIFVTHMRSESNTLYSNGGDGWFTDVTSRAGLGVPSLSYTGFGTAWTDVNLDGWLDLVIANGAVTLERNLVDAGSEFPYHQRNQLFLSLGDGRFREASDSAGPAFQVANVTRGAAVGDLDNDGRPDVVFANIEGPAQILLNRIDTEANWLGLELVDESGRRHATGAAAWLLAEDEPPHMRRARADGSYASAQDARVRFALGEGADPANVRVRWPDGSEEEFAALDVDRYHVLRQGEGAPVEKP
ncbi:MAG: CRTAC1 family protein [Gammaproteobacteria bacterium]|jgi:hypothetical protein